MLMTIGGLVMALILLVIAVATRKNWLRNFVVGGVAVWFLFYLVMLFGFSIVSTEKKLAMSEAKEYCGFYFDCHMHTAVTGVRTAKQIGEKNAVGEFYIVKVKVFSDAKNPNISFRLLEPKAKVIDGKGHTYSRNTDAEHLLPTAHVQLDQDIKGSQTIEKEIVFDITESGDGLKMLITEGYGIDKYIEAVLIDDEDSILHKFTYFNVGVKNNQAANIEISHDY